MLIDLKVNIYMMQTFFVKERQNPIKKFFMFLIDHIFAEQNHTKGIFVAKQKKGMKFDEIKIMKID